MKKKYPGRGEERLQESEDKAIFCNKISSIHHQEVVPRISTVWLSKLNHKMATLADMPTRTGKHQASFLDEDLQAMKVC